MSHDWDFKSLEKRLYLLPFFASGRWFVLTSIIAIGSELLTNSVGSLQKISTISIS